MEFIRDYNISEAARVALHVEKHSVASSRRQLPLKNVVGSTGYHLYDGLLFFSKYLSKDYEKMRIRDLK